MTKQTLPVLSDAEIAEYFAGSRLYGDDFDERRIAAWFRDEERSYYELAAAHRPSGFYDYHALNQLHGYSFFSEQQFDHILSFGGANGSELEPIAPRAKRITIIEPATYPTTSLCGVPVTYRKPNESGELPAAADEFELITSLGALHHVPNVTKIVREFSRVLRPGGYVLLRDPIVTMGDWRKHRPAQTAHERGIPLPIFDRIVADAGFRVHRRRRCVFPTSPRLGRLLRTSTFNSRWITRLDFALSCLLQWRYTYHPTRALQKLQPSSIFYVLQKP